MIALATAQQESRLRNLDYGDRDSLGLFQQRPSAGLGHRRRRCRTRSTPPDKFYDHLVEVPDWETGRLTENRTESAMEWLPGGLPSGRQWPLRWSMH